MASISQLTARLIDLFGSPASADPTKLKGNLTVSPNGNVLVGQTTDDGVSKLQATGTVKMNTSNFIINNPAATVRYTFTQSGTTNRWAYGADAVTETGSNAGSNFAIARYNDAGVFQDNALYIVRSTGVVQSSNGIAVTGFGGDGYGHYRMVNGNYGSFLRNDGTNTFLLSTASGSPYGTWNAYRPFYWNMTNGAVTIAGDGASTSVGGTLNVLNGSLWAYGYGGNNGAGALFLGNSGSRYLYYDGTNYNLPGAPLIVNGSGLQIRTYNTATGNPWYVGADTASAYCVYANGGTGVFLSWGSTAWGANSDERLKNVRSEITNGVEAINNIRTVRYSWKKDDDHCEALGVPNDSKVYTGVIAQDVQKFIPEAVYDQESGYLGVAYTELIPHCMAAIKELSAELNKVKAELAELKEKNNG